jgi:hypothetical protein
VKVVLSKLLRPFLEGSLLKRTLLHVGTLVICSVAFIALSSMVLVSIAKGLVAPSAPTNERTASAAAAATSEPAGADEDSDGPAAAQPPAGRPRLGGARAHGKKRFGAMAAPAPATE